MVPPTRRRVLGASVAVTALLAGCSGDDGSATSPTEVSTPADAATDAPTSESTATETGTAPPEASFDCAAAKRPEPTGSGEDDVEPVAYPERPDGEPDAEWAAAYEEAYIRNDIIQQESWVMTAWEEFSLADSRVEDHPRGTVVWLSGRYTIREEDGDRFTGQALTAGYYVDDRGVRRIGIAGELPEEVGAHPAVDGKTVECY